jgi:filamentous hemagglutinin family protein
MVATPVTPLSSSIASAFHKKGRRAPRPSLLAMSLAALFGVHATPTHAAGIVLTGRTATQLQVNGNVTNITTGTIAGGAGVNAFSTFDVDRAKTVNLVVPSNAKALLNLVYDAPININGTVNSLKDGKVGGNVIFADPHGMIVGSSGVLNVGSLTVTTPTKQFMDGVIDVKGNVSELAVSQMITGQVTNSTDGVIHIDGAVNALQKISLHAAKVAVAGTLKAGPDVLHQAAFYGSVNADNLQQAGGMVEHNGEIDIVADTSASISGTLDASRRQGAGTGGTIGVMASAVTIANTAHIDASGTSGGGQILVGVGQVNGATVHAASTLVAAGASVSADAVNQGNGGVVRVWGDSSNQMDGSVSAKGGALGGNGGLIELSAKQGLRITGRADTSAKAGQAGTVLIDPTDVSIVNGAAGSSTANVVTVGWLASEGDQNIALAADNTLTVGSSGGAAANVDLTSTLLTNSNTLSLTGKTVVVNSGSKILTGGGSVLLDGASITLGAGSVIDTATSAKTASRTAGDITLNAHSDISATSDLLAVASASATIDVFGTLVGNNVNLSATASATNSNVDATATGVYNQVEAGSSSIAAYLPTSLIYNDASVGVAIAQATASIVVHDGATVSALGDLNVNAHATQTSALSYEVGGSDDSSVSAAMIYSGLGGGATATIASGSTLNVGGNLLVKAVDDSSLAAAVKTVTGGGGAGITALVGFTNLNVAASIENGATVNLGAGSGVSVVARNNGSYSLSAESDNGAEQNSKAGIAVAISYLDSSVTASLGANIGSSATPAGNVLVQAENLVSQNSVGASTSTEAAEAKKSDSESTLSKIQGTDLYSFISGLIGNKTADANTDSGGDSSKNSPLSVGAAVALGINSLGANASVESGAGIYSSGDVAVVAHVSDADVHVTASSTTPSADKPGEDPSSTVAISASVALGFYNHTAQATVGPDSTITAAHIAVDSVVEVPFTVPLAEQIAGFTWGDWSSEESLLTAVYALAKDPTGVLTSYVDATGGATEGALSGAVSYLDFNNSSTAWIGQNSHLTSTAASDPFTITLQSDDATTPAPTLDFTKAVTVSASNLIQTITDAGNMDSLAGLPVKPGTSGGNVSVGGAANVVDYSNTTLAGVDDGVMIDTAAGTGVNVLATSTDFSVAVSPSAGSGAPIGVNGTVALTRYENQTHAIISSLATVNSDSVNIAAEDHLSTWTIAGALVSSSKAAVGAGVAVNDISDSTSAGVGTIPNGTGDAWRPAGMSSTVARTNTAGINANIVTVDASSEGQIFALAVAGSKSSASQDAGGGDGGTSGGSTSDPDATSSDSPSFLTTLMDRATTASDLIGGEAQTVMSTLGDLKDVVGKIGSLTSTKDDPPAADKKQEAGFGLAISGAAAVNTSALDTEATIDGATIMTPTLQVLAQNQSNLIAAGGSAALVTAGAPGGSSSSAAIAGALAINIEKNITNAAVSNSTVSNASDVSIKALASGEHLSIGIGAGVNTKKQDAVSVAGSVSLALIDNKTTASVTDSTFTGNAQTTGNGMTVMAYDVTETGVGGGALALGGDTGVGLALTYSSSNSTVSATLDNATVNTFGSLSVLALDPTLLMSGALEVAANKSENGIAAGGSFVFNDIGNDVTASIGGGSSITVSGALKVLASDDPQAEGLTPAVLAAHDVEDNSGQEVFDFNKSLLAGQSAPQGSAIYGVAGAVQVAKSAIGIAFVDNTIHNTHDASIAGATVHAGSAAITASDRSSILAIAAGVGVSTGDGGFAGVGSGTTNFLNNTTMASLGEPSSGSTSLTTTGSGANALSITANNNGSIFSVAGSIAASASDSPSVGVAIAYDSDDSTTEANISGATVTTTASNAAVRAISAHSIEAIAASVAATTGDLALAGSFSINELDDKTKSLVDNGSIINGGLIVDAGDNGSSNNAKIQSLAGGIALSGGAAVGAGVSVNQISSTYLASLDASTVNLPDAGALQVAATNSGLIYTAALGGAMGSDVAVGISTTVNTISNTVTGQLNAATVTSLTTPANTRVDIDATGNATIQALSGGIGVAPEGAGFGIGIATNRIDNTITAAMHSGSANVGDLVVNGQSNAEIDSIALGAAVGTEGGTAAGSVAVNLISTDVTGTIENTGTGGAQASVTARNNVGVLASNDDAIKSIAGAVSLGIGNTNLSVGASTAVNQIGGDTLAAIDHAAVDALGNGTGLTVTDGTLVSAGFDADMSQLGGYTAPTSSNNSLSGFMDPSLATTTKVVHGVAVNASSQRTLGSVAATGAVNINPDPFDPSLAISATITVNEIGGSTTANVQNAAIDQQTLVANSAQSVDVGASSHSYSESVVGALSAALWGGLGAAIDTESNAISTTAHIIDSAVKAANGIMVDARSTAGVSAIAAGFSAGAVGIVGTGEDATFTGTTLAAVDGGVLNADHLDVDADSANRIALLAGGVAGGAIGAAGSFAVLDSEQQTTARIGRSTAGNASSVNVGNAVNVVADSSTDSTIYSASAALSNGAGLGLAASVGLIENATEASIENGSSVTAGGNVLVNAADTGTLSLGGGALGADLSGVGVGVGASAAVSIVRSKVLAQIDNATVQGAGVTLATNNNQNISQNVVAVGIGGSAGLAGTVSVIMLGTGGDTATDPNATDATSVLTKVNTFSGGDKSGSTSGALTTDEANSISSGTQHGTGAALLATAASTPGGTSGSVAITSGAANSAHAYISGNSHVTTTGAQDLDLSGTTTTSTANNVGALAGSGTLGIGAAVAITRIYNDVGAVVGPNTTVSVAGSLNANATAQDGTSHAINDKIVAGALAGAGALAVNVGDERISDQVIADVGGAATVANQINVNATDTSSIEATSASAAVALGAGVGVVVLQAEKSGEIWAALNADDLATSAISARRIDVNASSSGIVSTTTYAAAGGMAAAVGVNSATSTDSVNVTASIGDNTAVNSDGDVVVNATRTPQAIAKGYGVGVSGGLQVGLTLADAEVSGTTLAQVGSNVVFTGIGLDSNNNLQFGTVDVTAGNLVSGAGYSASADAFASGGGVLLGVNGASATANNTSAVTSQVLNDVLLPMSDVTIAARNNSAQTAGASGISAGIVGVGANFANATSNTTTTAGLGSGAISAILVDANQNALAVRGGILDITADGTDNNNASAETGAGGVISGAAAVANTANKGTTTAGIADGASLYAATLSTANVLTKVALSNGIVSPLMTGDLTISAHHTSEFASQSDATQASLAGASGAESTGDVLYNVNANVGANVNLRSSNIAIDALNLVTERDIGDNAEGISGGGIAGAGVSSSNTITTQSNATIGANADLEVTGDPLAADHGRFSIIAATQIAATDSTTDTAGGAISGLTSDSRTVVSASNTLTIGDNATLDSIGDMDIGTYSLINVSNDSYAHGYGLAGGAGGNAVSDVTSNQRIAIGNNDDFTVWGNLSIATGRGDQATYQNSLTANASNRVYFDGAFNGTDPYGEAVIVNNGSITVGTGSQLDSVRDILLGTLHGVTTASAVGEGHYTVLGIPLTNDDTDLSNTGVQSVVFNGTAVAGTRHSATLNIDAAGNITASNVDYNTLASYVPVGQLEDQIARLTTLKSQPGTDPTTQTDIQGSIDALTALSNTLQGRGLTPTTSVSAVEVTDTLAAGGNIEVNADVFSGTGSMTAYGGPEISLTNASSKFLVTDQLFIPNELGGNIQFTGTGKGSTSYLAGNVHQINANAAASIVIDNTYDAAHNGGIPPAIFLTDSIENRGGSLYIFNASGDLGQFGAVSVNQQTILLPNGAYIVDTPDAGQYLGGNPDTEYTGSNGSIYQLLWNQGFSSSMTGTALPVTANEAVTYVANYLAPGYGCAATGSAASFGACLAGNPPSGDGHNESGTGYMFFYPSNAYNGDNGGSSPGSYTSQYGGDIGFYDGRYAYPSVGVRNLTNTITTLAPANAKTNVTKVGLAAVINAKYIDMNGTLQVGLDSDFSASITPVMINTGVDVNNHPIQTDLIACINDVVCRPYAAIYKGSDGLYKYPGNAVITSDNTPINVYYNAATQQLVLDNVSGGGSGSVTLQGAIINTNPLGGNTISVSDGYAHVTVNNTTGATLLTRDINTGDGNVGVVKITDTLKTDTSGHALTTWYVYKLGEGVSTYSSNTATDFTGLTATANSTGNSAVYDPLAGERYTWSYTANLTRSYSDPNGGYFQNLLTDWSFTTLPSNQPNTYQNVWTLTDGLANDASLENTAFQEKITGSANTYSEGNGLGYSYHGPFSWIWYVPTAVQIVATTSVKADNPVNISFTGTNSSGLVKVNSNSSIVVGGNIQNIAGSTEITATGRGSTITSNSNGQINTQSLVLTADGGIGNVSTPMAINLRNPAGATAGENTVIAVTRTGDIGLAFNGADAILKQIKTDSNSDVLLSAYGSLINGAASGSASVIGRNISLVSSNGSIGTIAAPLIVDPLATTAASGVVSGGVVNAQAYGDIGLEQLSGDMYIGHVVSANGDVALTAATGSLLDGSDIDSSDKTAALAAVWDKLNLLDTRSAGDQNDITKSAAYATVVVPYEKGVISEYQSYWTLLGLGRISTDGNTFTLSSSGAIALQAQADGAGQSVAAYAQARYATLKSDLQAALGSVTPDWQSAYDSTFTYSASADQVAAMTRGQYWTSDALLYSINNAALQPASGAVTLVTDANVTGKNVTLSAAHAGIGSLATAVHFDLSSGGLTNLTPSQKAALLTANSAGDVINQVYDRNGSPDLTCSSLDPDCQLVSFDIKQTNPLLVDVFTGLTARAGTDIFIQAKDSLPIADIEAGRDAQITAMSGITNVAAGNADAITTGRDLTLQNGLGSIGSAARGISLNVAGQLQSARSGDAGGVGDMYLSALHGDLSFDDLYASRILSLSTFDTTAGSGNIYSRNAIAGVGVTSVAAQFLVLNTTGSVYGIDDSHPLLVDIGSAHQTGAVSGTVGGDLYLLNDNLLGIGHQAVGTLGDADYLAAADLHVKGNAHLNSSADGIVFAGSATQIDGALTIDNTTSVGFDAASNTNVSGTMTINAHGIAMQAGSRVQTAQLANWTVDTGDMSVAYLSGPNIELNAVSGKILGVAGSPIDQGENVHTTGTLTLNGGAAGAQVDGGGIGLDADHRLLVAATTIDSADAMGNTFLGLRSSSDITVHNVAAMSSAGNIDVASPIDFVATKIVSDSGAFSATDADTGGDILLSTTGSAVMTLDNIQAGRDFWITTVDGGVATTPTSQITVTRDLHVLMTGAGVMSDGSTTGITAGRDIDMNAAALTLNNVKAQRDLNLIARVADIDYNNLTAVKGDVIAQAAGDITGTVGGMLLAGGNAKLTGVNMTLPDVRATDGEIDLTATGDVGYLNLAAGTDVQATITGALTGGAPSTIVAGRDVGLTAASAILKDVTATRDASIETTAGAISDTATIQTQGKAHFMAATDLTLNQLSALGNADASAAGNITVTTVQVGDATHPSSLTLSATGDIELGDATVWGDATSGSDNLTITRGDVHGMAKLTAKHAITVTTLAVGEDALLTAGRMALNTLTSGADIMLSALVGDVNYTDITAAGNLVARVAGMLDGASTSLMQTGAAIDAQAAGMAINRLVAGSDTKLVSTSDSIAVDSAHVGGNLQVASAVDAYLGAANVSGAASVNTLGSAHIAQLQTTGAMQLNSGVDATIDALQIGDTAHASSLVAQVGDNLALGSGDIWGDMTSNSGSLNIGTVHIHGRSNLEAVHDIDVGNLVVDGDLMAQAGGQMAMTSTSVGGDANLTAASMALGNVTTGHDLTLNAVAGDIDYLNLHAGHDLNATVSGSLQDTGAGVLSAANDVTITADQSINFDQIQGGHDVTLNAGGDVRGNSLVAGHDLEVKDNGYLVVGNISAGNALTLESLLGIDLHVVSANDFTVKSRGNVNLDSVLLGDALQVQADGLNANVKQTGDHALTMDISGYQNGHANGTARASVVNLNVDAPSGLDFARLWADNANITSTANENIIENGFITHVLDMNTPAGRILMNNDSIKSVPKVAVQLYEPFRSFALIEDGRYFYSSALITQFGFVSRDFTNNFTTGRYYVPTVVYNTSAEREVVRESQMVSQEGFLFDHPTRPLSLPKSPRSVIKSDDSAPSNGLDFGIVNTIKVSMATPQ